MGGRCSKGQFVDLATIMKSFFHICMVERLKSCKIWLWRKVLNITWSDKICKEEVLRRVGEERAIISVINRRQRVCWLGHTLRHCDLVPLVIEGIIIGKRPPGRPRAGMLDRVKDGSPYIAVKRRALDAQLPWYERSC